jgi:hypothetical protein
VRAEHGGNNRADDRKSRRGNSSRQEKHWHVVTTTNSRKGRDSSLLEQQPWQPPQQLKAQSCRRPSEMAGIAFMSEGAANQVDWRAAMVADRIAKTESLPESGSTFLAKREC